MRTFLLSALGRPDPQGYNYHYVSRKSLLNQKLRTLHSGIRAFLLADIRAFLLSDKRTKRLALSRRAKALCKQVFPASFQAARKEISAERAVQRSRSRELMMQDKMQWLRSQTQDNPPPSSTSDEANPDPPGSRISRSSTTLCINSGSTKDGGNPLQGPQEDHPPETNVSGNVNVARDAVGQALENTFYGSINGINGSAQGSAAVATESGLGPGVDIGAAAVGPAGPAGVTFTNSGDDIIASARMPCKGSLAHCETVGAENSSKQAPFQIHAPASTGSRGRDAPVTAERAPVEDAAPLASLAHVDVAKAQQSMDVAPIHDHDASTHAISSGVPTKLETDVHMGVSTCVVPIEANVLCPPAGQPQGRVVLQGYSPTDATSTPAGDSPERHSEAGNASGEGGNAEGEVQGALLLGAADSNAGLETVSENARSEELLENERSDFVKALSDVYTWCQTELSHSGGDVGDAALPSPDDEILPVGTQYWLIIYYTAGIYPIYTHKYMHPIIACAPSRTVTTRCYPVL